MTVSGINVTIECRVQAKCQNVKRTVKTKWMKTMEIQC